MSFYDTFKDVLNIAQKADNVDLYRQLLDLENQAIEMQSEITRLKEENTSLRKEKELEDRITRHQKPYITLKDEQPEVRYCSVCWGKEKKLIQLMDDKNCLLCIARLRGTTKS